MPDTLDYMILGYIVAFTLLGLLIGSIVWRYRSCAKTEELLAQLEASEQTPTASTPSSPASSTATNTVPSR
ncbi:MAG: hypothetical protein DPW16_03685 [Chloroflexi bacterium]|nr:hypothetical protein [Chloroflexota bacterium]